jgi:hypothetical protein
MEPHWMDRPILFLDIDGVLNSHEFCRRVPQRGIIGIDPLAVAHLQRIVDETNCSLVLSSTWRKLHMMSEMRDKLATAGMKRPVPLVDKTPDLGDDTSRGRGLEVNAWLNRTGFRGRYVCLDDDHDFLPGQPLVRTHFEFGLTSEIADQCIRVLLNRS